MTDEITYLENIRNSLLHLQDLPLVLCVNNDKQYRKKTAWNTAKMHLHELFEMRILFGLSDGQIRDCGSCSDLGLRRSSRCDFGSSPIFNDR